LHLALANAINIYKDVLSRNIIVMHFRTFVRSEKESLKAIIESTKKRENRDILSLDKQAVKGRGRANILNISKSVVVKINVHEVFTQN
jgi:N-acyl-phosphatidylethanolamine-hydrolysing phospholipase D